MEIYYVIFRVGKSCNFIIKVFRPGKSWNFTKCNFHGQKVKEFLEWNLNLL